MKSDKREQFMKQHAHLFSNEFCSSNPLHCILKNRIPLFDSLKLIDINAPNKAGSCWIHYVIYSRDECDSDYSYELYVKDLIEFGFNVSMVVNNMNILDHVIKCVDAEDYDSNKTYPNVESCSDLVEVDVNNINSCGDERIIQLKNYMKEVIDVVNRDHKNRIAYDHRNDKLYDLIQYLLDIGLTTTEQLPCATKRERCVSRLNY
jgi:hypothetical protein